jgi:hypothetical protein
VHKISRKYYLNEKRLKKRKRKRIPSQVGRGGFGPARRGARAREGTGLAAALGRGDGAGARERRRHRGAHTSARAEGETVPRVDGAGEPAVRRG